MVEKPNKLQPALMGGVVLGLLSSIPFISAGNICCCLWVLLGGALAARMLIKRSPVLPVTTGDGAVVGALAGVVGSVINLIIGIPLGLLMGQGVSRKVLEGMRDAIDDPAAKAQIEQMINQAANQPFAQQLVSALIAWLVSSALFIGFGALGGIIGVALFEKRKGQMPPAGPQGYPPPGYPPPGYNPPSGYNPPPGPPPGPSSQG